LTRNCRSSLSAYLIARGYEGGGREDPNGYQIGTSAVPIAFCCPLLTEQKQCNKVENSAIKCYFIAPFLAKNGAVMRI
jgi:hypothetical protein